MQKSALFFSLLLLLLLTPLTSEHTAILLLKESVHAEIAPTPLPPESGAVEQLDSSEKVPDKPRIDTPIISPKLEIKKEVTTPDYPVSIFIPSLKQTNAIVKVGVNKKGEMEVPDGNTTQVGWWEDGTVPGDTGSAVMDAHVYAAFRNLRYLKIGSDVYVTMASGEKLHFKVEDSRLYSVHEVPLDFVFNRSDQARLNFITCAGKLTKDRSTYEKRLIVYTQLVK